MITTKLTFY